MISEVQLSQLPQLLFSNNIINRMQMDSSLKITVHRQKVNKMRNTLKGSPLMKRFTLPLQEKLQKKARRRSSATMEAPFLDKELADSEDERENSDLDTDFSSRYIMGDKLGEGAHGVVRKCYHKLTNELQAVKTMLLDREHILYLKENFIDIKRLKHPNIISYKAIFFDMARQTCHLVMDFLPYPDLLQVKIANEDELKEIVYQIVQTLRFVHQNKICHRDIKPENILYNEHERKIVLVDFGISKKLMRRGIKREMLTLTGTPYYRAPEMFEGGGYDQLVDMWALGVTIFKLMSGVTPFQSEYHSETIDNIMKAELVFSPKLEAKYSKQARMFVSRLLKRRKERMSSKDALKDIWFMGMEHNQGFIRSTTMNGRCKQLPSQSINMMEVSLDIRDLGLTRTQTGVKEDHKDKKVYDKEEIKKSLKKLEDIEQQESNIFGFEDESSPTKRPRTTASPKRIQS